MLDLFFNLDSRTLLMVLFYGNIVSVGLISAFYYTTSTGRSWATSRPLFCAKAFQAAGYFFMMQRNFIHPLLSVNLGNSLAFIGFAYEGLATFRLLNEEKQAKIWLRSALLLSVLGFNLFEFLYADPSIRVATASVCVPLLLFLPCLRLFISPNSSRFKRCAGIMYLGVVIMMIPRAISAMTGDVSLFTNNYVQVLTFLAMVLQLVFGLPAYLLLNKEESDRIIAVMASTDMLTGLSNRYSFLETAQRVFTRNRVNKSAVAILFIDIDHFKKVNDTYGHCFGDAVLAALGRSINESLRPTDLACRYGGEEFVILLQQAEKDIAIRVAERLRGAAGRLSFPEAPEYRLTFSAGVAAGAPSEKDTLERFINHADAALYTAKRTGRDRVVVHGEEAAASGEGGACSAACS